MKEDPIKELMEKAVLNTSQDFTATTMEKLDKRIRSRMKVRLYLLITCISLFFLAVVVILIYTGFSIKAFGWILNLPKLVTMITFSMMCYFTIMHLLVLLRLGGEKA